MKDIDGRRQRDHLRERLWDPGEHSLGINAEGKSRGNLFTQTHLEKWLLKRCMSAFIKNCCCVVHCELLFSFIHYFNYIKIADKMLLSVVSTVTAE